MLVKGPQLDQGLPGLGSTYTWEWHLVGKDDILLQYKLKENYCAVKSMLNNLISRMGFPISVRWHLCIKNWLQVCVGYVAFWMYDHI